MDSLLEELRKHPIRTRLSLTGTLIVARDIAHARLRDIFNETGKFPQYMLDHPVYYAGPAKQPEGLPSGSFGPTTASRMDPYAELFMKHGASMVSLAKGNRTQRLVKACRDNSGFYLGSIGGPAAILAQDSIQSVEVLDFEDLGMEAVWKIRVKDFPAFVVVDHEGNDFFAEVMKTTS
jgi:fumarate hydratase, class I